MTQPTENNLTAWMERLVRDMAARYEDHGRRPSAFFMNDYQQAVDIVSMLPKPVDQEKEAVREIARMSGVFPAHEDSSPSWGQINSYCGWALAALRRGREMERDSK